MESYDPNQKFKGPVYVLKIKSSKDYDSTELLYALAFKGDSSFGLMNFKEIAEVENQTFCLVQKVDNGNDVTWSQCMSEAGDLKPKGRAHTMIIFIYKVVFTFKVLWSELGPNVLFCSKWCSELNLTTKY